MCRLGKCLQHIPRQKVETQTHKHFEQVFVYTRFRFRWRFSVAISPVLHGHGAIYLPNSAVIDARPPYTNGRQSLTSAMAPQQQQLHLLSACNSLGRINTKKITQQTCRARRKLSNRPHCYRYHVRYYRYLTCCSILTIDICTHSYKIVKQFIN